MSSDVLHETGESLHVQYIVLHLYPEAVLRKILSFIFLTDQSQYITYLMFFEMRRL